LQRSKRTAATSVGRNHTFRGLKYSEWVALTMPCNLVMAEDYRDKIAIWSRMELTVILCN
jgi:hypothetical protein